MNIIDGFRFTDKAVRFSLFGAVRRNTRSPYIILLLLLLLFRACKTKRGSRSYAVRRRPFSHEFKAIEMCVVTAATTTVVVVVVVDLVRTRTTHVSVSFVSRDVGSEWRRSRSFPATRPTSDRVVRKNGKILKSCRPHCRASDSGCQVCLFTRRHAVRWSYTAHTARPSVDGNCVRQLFRVIALFHGSVTFVGLRRDRQT